MSKKPNIIIFNPDQWRGDVLGHVGNPAAVTPNIDALIGSDGVSFTSAFCQPCRATKRTLERVADMMDGVVYAEVDAESQLELTRQFNVMRTPTVFILEPTGAVAHRAAGQPRCVAHLIRDVKRAVVVCVRREGDVALSVRRKGAA